MCEHDWRMVMIAGCQIVYDGITYKYIRSIELEYDRHLHKVRMFLVLQDMRANSVVRVNPEKSDRYSL